MCFSPLLLLTNALSLCCSGPTAIPVALFFFSTSQKSFYIYESLDESLQNNLEWWDRINHVAFSILVVVGATVGIVGAVYMNDGDPPPNILLLDCQNDPISKLMRAAFAVVLILTSPPTFHVARDMVMGLLFPRDRYDPFHTMRGKENFKIAYRESAFRDSTALSDDTDDTSDVGVAASGWWGMTFGAQDSWNGSYEQQRIWNANVVMGFTWIAVALTSTLSTEIFENISSATNVVIAFIAVFFVVASHSSLNVRGQEAVEEDDALLQKNQRPSYFWISIDKPNSCRLKSGANPVDILIMSGFAFVLVGYFFSYTGEPAAIAAALGACMMYIFIALAGQIGRKSPLHFNSEFGESLLYNTGGKGSAYRSSLDDIDGDEISALQMSEPSSTHLLSMEDIEIPVEKLTFQTNIANGGFGIVSKYLYEGTIVAVKQIKSSAQYQESEVLHLARLNHPNVVRMMGVSYDDQKCVLLIMEYCEHNLPDAVRSENYTESHFWRWSTSIARTMEWMHSRNVIHRDLKPQNILISNFPDRNGNAQKSDVKICDFGFARFCNVGTCSEMSVLGTWAYMPPEVMKMSINTNRKTQYDGRKFDIYSFSMILYFMWARREPFWDISYARLPLEIALGNARPCISYLLAAAEEGASQAGTASSAASQTSDGVSHDGSSTTNTTTSNVPPQESSSPIVTPEQRFEPNSMAVPEPLSLSSSSRKTLTLMSRCWSSDIRKRPQFEDIHAVLRTITPKFVLELEIQ
jgi:serine/threonine protein kinase